MLILYALVVLLCNQPPIKLKQFCFELRNNATAVSQLEQSNFALHGAKQQNGCS